jgi:hypothetical protein
MPTVTQCFSALIVSGNGQRCNKVKESMHTHLLESDSDTGEIQSILYKYHQNDCPEQYVKIKRKVANIINPFLKDVDIFYFGNDIEGQNES